MNHQHDDWGDDGGLGPAFDAFAEARLRADPTRTGVVRARVMAAARAEARRNRSAARRPDASRPRRWGVLPRFPRFARVPMLAAASLLLLALAAGGALAWAGPGGPLYGARLWVEELLLPTTPDAREAAQLDRLDERLAEARAAAERGDVAALVAALEEYRATAEEAVAAAGDDAARRAHVAEQIARHVAVLEELTTTAPPRAAEAIRTAVDRAESRIEAILDGRAGPGSQGPADPTAKPRPTPKERPETTPKPTKTPPGRSTPEPKATPTPKPTKTPPGRSTPEPKATPTPKPTKTPPGRSTPEP